MPRRHDIIIGRKGATVSRSLTDPLGEQDSVLWTPRRYTLTDGIGLSDSRLVDTGATPTMPTQSNTGPGAPSSVYEPSATVAFSTALAAGGATNKIITGVTSLSTAPSASDVWTFTDCWFPGQLAFTIDDGTGNYGLGVYPTLTLNRCRIDGGFVFIGGAYVNMNYCLVEQGAGMITGCPDCAGSAYSRERQMPWVVQNSWFRSPQGDPSSGFHYEGMHIAGSCQGMSFYNTRIIQEGPLNGTQTGALFFHGGNCDFDWCWFDSNGTGTGANFAVYSYGYGAGAADNNFTNCRFGATWGAPFYPITSEGFPSSAIANVTNCIDTTTGNTIPQPTT